MNRESWTPEPLPALVSRKAWALRKGFHPDDGGPGFWSSCSSCGWEQLHLPGPGVPQARTAILWGDSVSEQRWAVVSVSLARPQGSPLTRPRGPLVLLGQLAVTHAKPGHELSFISPFFPNIYFCYFEEKVLDQTRP